MRFGFVPMPCVVSERSIDLKSELLLLESLQSFFAAAKSKPNSICCAFAPPMSFKGGIVSESARMCAAIQRMSAPRECGFHVPPVLHGVSACDATACDEAPGSGKLRRLASRDETNRDGAFVC